MPFTSGDFNKLAPGRVPLTAAAVTALQEGLREPGPAGEDRASGLLVGAPRPQSRLTPAPRWPLSGRGPSQRLRDRPQLLEETPWGPGRPRASGGVPRGSARPLDSSLTPVLTPRAALSKPPLAVRPVPGESTLRTGCSLSFRALAPWELSSYLWGSLATSITGLHTF